MPNPARTVAAIVYFHALGMLLIISSPPRRCLHKSDEVNFNNTDARDYHQITNLSAVGEEAAIINK